MSTMSTMSSQAIHLLTRRFFSVANMWTKFRLSDFHNQIYNPETVFHWKKLELCWTYPCIQPPRSIPEPLSETRNCSLHNWKDLFLVGGFSPSHDKYAQVKMGENLPQIEVNMKNMFEIACIIYMKNVIYAAANVTSPPLGWYSPLDINGCKWSPLPLLGGSSQLVSG